MEDSNGSWVPAAVLSLESNGRGFSWRGPGPPPKVSMQSPSAMSSQRGVSFHAQRLSIYQSNRTPSLLIIKNEPHVALVTLVDALGVVEHENLVALSSRSWCWRNLRSAIPSSQSVGLGLAAIQSSRLVGSSFQPSVFPIQSADVQCLSIHQSNRTPSLLIIKNEPHVALVTLVDVSGVIEHGNLVAYSLRPRCLSSPRSAVTSSQSAGLGLAAIQSSRLVGSSLQPSVFPIQSAGVQRLSIHQSNRTPSLLIIKNEPHVALVTLVDVLGVIEHGSLVAYSSRPWRWRKSAIPSLQIRRFGHRVAVSSRPVTGGRWRAASSALQLAGRRGLMLDHVGFRNLERASPSVSWLGYRGGGCWVVGPHTRVCALSPFFLGVHGGHWGVYAYACHVVGACRVVGGEQRVFGCVLLVRFSVASNFFRRATLV